MDDQSKSVREWSSLPSDMLSKLLNYLNDTENDRRRLRGVCISWRSYILPPISPLKFPITIEFPFPPLLSCIGKKESGFLRQSIFYLIYSPVKSSVWLTRVEEKPSLPNTYQLQNPITPCDEFCRPSPELKVTVNFLDYMISQVARSYSLHGCINQLLTKKSVMLPKSGATADNFSLLARWNDSQLGCYKSGAPENWVNISKNSGVFSDIIAYEGMFYATNLEGKLISIDPVTFEVKEIIQSNSEAQQSDRLFTYLVESRGRLYLINKGINNTTSVDDEITGNNIQLKVFTLSCSRSPNGGIDHFWEPVTSLGDRMFFVSEYVTFCLSAQKISWGNSIFFTEEGFMGYGYYDYDGFEFDDDDFDLFSKCCGLYNLEDSRITTRDSLPSEFTNIFWPVPTWLVSNDGTTS